MSPPQWCCYFAVAAELYKNDVVVAVVAAVPVAVAIIVPYRGIDLI